jgi:DNA-binding transcriptional MerR regulator
MPDAVEIPNRALFKPAEVCEIAKLQPYVLRSWETEFPDLGVAKTPNAARVYRRSDVERVLRIKHLVFGEGLTLAGVRRRLDEESTPVALDAPIEELLGKHARERLALVRHGLRSLLDLLSHEPGNGTLDYELSPPPIARAAVASRTRAPNQRAARPPKPAPTKKKRAN